MIFEVAQAANGVFHQASPIQLATASHFPLFEVLVFSSLFGLRYRRMERDLLMVKMFFDEKSSLQTLIRRGFQTIRVPLKIEKRRGTRIGTRMDGTNLYPIETRFNTTR
jgi:hypothetical protein